MINKFLTLCFISMLSIFVGACSSTQKISDNLVNLTAQQQIMLPEPSFNKESSTQQLLTTIYKEKKHTLLVLLDIKKDSVKLTGLTPSSITLFTLVYDKHGIEAKYEIPQAMLPPVKQVLLDILLAFDDNQSFEKVLPQGYKIQINGTQKVLKDNFDKIIYTIEYSSMNNSLFANKIENLEFGYTIKIKYL